MVVDELAGRHGSARCRTPQGPRRTRAAGARSAPVPGGAPGPPGGPRRPADLHERVRRPGRRRCCASSPSTVERLVVVHDELDIPAGAVRLKRGGARAGTTACARSAPRSAPRTTYGCASASAARPGGWTRRLRAARLLGHRAHGAAVPARRRPPTPSSRSSRSACSTRSSGSTRPALSPAGSRHVRRRVSARRIPRGQAGGETVPFLYSSDQLRPYGILAGVRIS